MELKRKFENIKEYSVDNSPRSLARAKKHEKLDKLVKEASLRVSNILGCEDTWNGAQPDCQIRPTLVSTAIKVPNDFMKTKEAIEPKWAKHIRKECNVQFVFRRGKSSSIGEIILTGLKPNIEQADYLTRMLLQRETGHHEQPNQTHTCYSMLPIPAHMVGYIVGRNGERIRQIMDASSTEINIEGPSSSDIYHSKMAIIVGSAACVQLAQAIIEKNLYLGRLLLRTNPNRFPSHIQQNEEWYMMMEQFFGSYHSV